MSFLTRACLASLCALTLAACGGSELVIHDTLNGDAFVRVSRDALGGADAGSVEGVVSTGDENFYLAINKAQLSGRFFLSAYLSQWSPVENVAMRSLGTRVVSFKQQNGKLFVFDAADGKGWSDTLDPTIVLEAWPVVTTNAAFNALPNASSYVLVDPAAGLNRFSFVADDFASQYQARFQVDLSYLQRFRALGDGVAFDEVFTGYTEVPAQGINAWTQPFRGSGTLTVSLRRYQESAGFAPTELTDTHFFGSEYQYVQNEPRVKRNAVKWNVHPGMQPIDWRISQAVQAYANDPRLAGIDVAGAIKQGVEGWNQVFGYPVFRVVPTAASDAPGDDDKNFIIVDRNPGAGLAFANWRENPNTGEIRGASVYFSSVFIEEALTQAPWDGGVVDAGVAVDAGAALDAGRPVDAGTMDAGAVDPCSLPWPFTPASCGGDAGTLDAGRPVDAGTLDAGAVDPCSLPWPFTPASCGGDAGTIDAGSSCALSLVINQVYGGGAASGTFNQDFVELHNRGTQAVSLTGWSLQYASATGTSWQVVPLKGTVAAGGFFLVGFAATSGTNPLLATADQLVGINLSAASGKVALVNNGTNAALTGSCPTGAVDLVGFGGATCFEGNAAPTASGVLSVTRRDACVDTNNNLADFAAQTPAPHSTATTPVACACAAPVVVTPVSPVTSPDGGVALTPPTAAVPGAALSWDAMPQASTCQLTRSLAQADVPAGLTRKQFLEAIITHTILHEVGHTLGLRHNFKGSLEGSSVMDYLNDADAAQLTQPGAYDVAAVKFLYGLATPQATQAFCTDEDTLSDARCDRFDSSATPLTSDVGPRYVAKLRAQLAGTGSLTYGDLQQVTRYVRAPSSEAERLEAFNTLLGQLAPPLAPDVTALSTNAAAWADVLAATMLKNLFLDPAAWRDPIAVTPALTDATFRARVIEVSKNILVNSDQVRSFETRRVAIDVLKALQTADAYQALLDARASLVTERATYNALGQALVDDLTHRLDLACTPYFY